MNNLSYSPSLGAYVDKSQPTDAWISALRQKFPVEREIDRVLTDKLRRRAGPGFSSVSLDTVASSLAAFLKVRIDGDFTISDLKWLGGGASKLQTSFVLDRPNSAGPERMVLRMDLPQSNAETSRTREFELLRAIEGTLPVPRPYWLDAAGEFLPYPGVICSFVPGVTKPTGRVSQVTGLGIDFGPSLRAHLGHQVARDMGTLHRWDWAAANLPSFDIPQPGTRAMEWHLNNWLRVWEEDAGEEEPLINFASLWLAQNIPATETLSLIHCDFRAGNFLFDEASGNITAWLDWELARIGDRHEDLALMSLECMGHYSETGDVFLTNGFLPEEEFLGLYEQHSGLAVDQRRLAYYRIFHAYRAAIILLATGYRAVKGGKSHQDMTLSIMLAFGARLLDDLRKLLEEHA
jgi:aminoglycoside phosphotransferase (APT) family kinase protein